MGSAGYLDGDDGNSIDSQSTVTVLSKNTTPDGNNTASVTNIPASCFLSPLRPLSCALGSHRRVAAIAQKCTRSIEHNRKGSSQEAARAAASRMDRDKLMQTMSAEQVCVLDSRVIHTRTSLLKDYMDHGGQYFLSIAQVDLTSGAKDHAP